jgi:hypothetical protein
VGQDRRDVRGQEVLTVADAGDERDVLAGTDDPVGLVAMHDREGVGALELAEGGPDRVGDVALIGLLDEMGDGFGVGLRDERVTPLGEPVAELPEVLDDAVVDDRDPAGAIHLGMGVDVVRPAVRRPAGMGQPDRRVGRPLGDRRGQVRELAGLLLDEEIAGLVHEGDAGRVIAPVFEPLEALHQDRTGFAGARIADDSAHRRSV